MSLNPVFAEISRSALRHNLQVVRNFAPDAKVLAMIKANGYGHDSIEVAKVFSKAEPAANAFGVARLNEALLLRDADIKTSVVLMEGCFNIEELQCASEQQFEIVLHNHQQLEQLLSAQLKNPMSIWLKIDTGMGRVGFDPSEANEVLAQLEQSDNVQTPITCMTHFACADDVDNDKNQQQLRCFQNSFERSRCLSSCANSAAIISNQASHYDWVRPGIMLYGSAPLQNSICSDHDLKPAMSLNSIVIAVKPVKKGASVGYGSRWIANKDSQIAVVAIGYGDGYPRSAKDGTPVMINGEIYPLAGRVSMDMITVDIGNDSDIKMGDRVLLWGEDKVTGNILPAETVARSADTISYEMFCNLAGRVEKRFVED